MKKPRRFQAASLAVLSLTLTGASPDCEIDESGGNVDINIDLDGCDDSCRDWECFVFPFLDCGNCCD